MIAGLCPSLDHLYLLSGVGGGLGEDLEEEGFGHVMGARTREEAAAWAQDLDGPKINLLIASACGRNAVAVLGESGGVEDDEVEAPSRFIVFLEHIEGIAFAEGNI